MQDHFRIAIDKRENEKKKTTTQRCTRLYLCSNSSNSNEILIKFKYALKYIQRSYILFNGHTQLCIHTHACTDARTDESLIAFLMEKMLCQCTVIILRKKRALKHAEYDTRLSLS